jgi:hypothetical protein
MVLIVLRKLPAASNSFGLRKLLVEGRVRHPSSVTGVQAPKAVKLVGIIRAIPEPSLTAQPYAAYSAFK